MNHKEHSTTTRLVELDSRLDRQLIEFVDTHPEWTLDQVFVCAVSRFLLQRRLEDDGRIAREFVHEMFNIANKNRQQSAP